MNMFLPQFLAVVALCRHTWQETKLSLRPPALEGRISLLLSLLL